MEVWRDILGYEGIYQVSNLARVKRLCSYVNSRIGKRLVRERILREDNSKEYKTVSLSKLNKKTTVSIHRITAVAFIPNPENKPCINHKNGIKTDNSISNLEWCTVSENTLHASRVLGIKFNSSGKDDSQSKAVYQISENGFVLARFGSISEAVRMTGTPKSTISRNVNRKNQSGNSYGWSFDQSTPQEISA